MLLQNAVQPSCNPSQSGNPGLEDSRFEQSYNRWSLNTFALPNPRRREQPPLSSSVKPQAPAPREPQNTDTHTVKAVQHGESKLCTLRCLEAGLQTRRLLPVPYQAFELQLVPQQYTNADWQTHCSQKLQLSHIPCLFPLAKPHCKLFYVRETRATQEYPAVQGP